MDPVNCVIMHMLSSTLLMSKHFQGLFIWGLYFQDVDWGEDFFLSLSLFYLNNFKYS